MTEGLATEIAKDFMRDLGFKRKQYMFRFRHLCLPVGEKRVLKGENHLLILLSATGGSKIQSKAGVFDLGDLLINEMQHVHRGLTWITNTGARPCEVYFLQVIPKNKKTENGRT